MIWEESRTDVDTAAPSTIPNLLLSSVWIEPIFLSVLTFCGESCAEYSQKAGLVIHIVTVLPQALSYTCMGLSLS